MKSRSFLGGIGTSEEVKYPDITLDLTYSLATLAEDELRKNNVGILDLVFFTEEVDNARSHTEILEVIEKWMCVK